MNKEKLEQLNKLLKTAFKFGWEVGYSFYKYREVTDVNGHLINESLYQQEALAAAKELAPLFGLTADEIEVYMLEDCSTYENDWDYIPPIIAKKGN